MKKISGLFLVVIFSICSVLVFTSCQNSVVDEAASVKTITGGTVEGLNVNLEVSQTVINVDLSGMITVSSGSSWQLYADITGQMLIPTKIAANLNNGDNTYYIVANSSDGKVNRTYTLNIYKIHYVTITYMSAGKVYDTQQISTHTTLDEGPAIIRSGYTFDGWECSGHYVTQSKTFTANWINNTYTLTLNANGGSVSQNSKTVTFGSIYSLSIPSRIGYSFIGWKSDDIMITGANGDCIGVWSVAGNKTAYAQWSVNSYNVVTNKNIDTAGNVTGASEHDFDSHVTITATTNAGYTWQGWYDGETPLTTDLSYTFTMPAENKTYEARWAQNEGTVSFNANGGTGTMSSGSITTRDTLLPNTFTKTYYTFKGWSLTPEGVVAYSDQSTFIVIVDGATYTLYAQWSPIYVRSGNYIWFGEYPQTIKAGSVTVGDTADSQGYFLGSDEARYAKVVASPCTSGYTFSTGAVVTSGTTYYFKVEPIKWRILEESNGTAFILAELIIDNHRYAASSSNYMNSEIRAWLNNQFYNTAFNDLQKQIILTTNVDNSAASTGTVPNQYACANTNDKVFLLSYAEAGNTSYGFRGGTGSDTARERLTSDYSRSKGAYMGTTAGTQYGNGGWWLRSPYDGSSSAARYVYDYGFIISNNVSGVFDGVVSALKIQLS